MEKSRVDISLLTSCSCFLGMIVLTEMNGLKGGFFLGGGGGFCFL